MKLIGQVIEMDNYERYLPQIPAFAIALKLNVWCYPIAHDEWKHQGNPDVRGSDIIGRSHDIWRNT